MSSSDKPPTTTARPNQPPGMALLVYPVTLIVGSLFSVLSPTAQGSRDHAIDQTGPLAPTIAADLNLPQPPVNYFARKDNIFNVYFVKVGWLWTTLAFSFLLFSLPSYAAPSSHQPRRIGQAIARYALATLVWYLTTQWFFGPAIIDRSFVFTGGKCERMVPLAEGEDSPSLHTLFTAAACKSAGGSWRGGHDVSGHVFMLVLATSMLVFETVGALASENGAKKADNGDESSVALKKLSVRFAWAVSGLGWWMLLMTAIWFHTWFEKLTGLLIALGTVYTIYVLPRRNIPWRDAVGLPGV
ncbi:putative inositol phospholipid biosynthesis protein Scs3 [Aspergillus melleus]|uniref:putative inositol phospholipid biosynthesis protein Scs3 n=1 Tax=Aspergillus melleus TaxID=138277 RepID=UPI001E8E0477|nr:uncharacterized protein LDX57_000492 [Aspergillus melleus]KAH8422736.1 hypothetical protein LDX57_000492 [Aspergillus melleus]